MWCLQVSILFGLMKVGGVLHEDKWLWQFFQTSEFDGSWPTVLCAVYQGMYLYQTALVCSHASKRTRHKPETLLNSGLLTVSLFRKQHLQNLLRTVATEITHLKNFHEYNGKDLERLRLGVPKEASVLVSLLLTSIQTTINELQEWASQVVGIHDGWPPSKVVWDEAKIIKEGLEKTIPHAMFSKKFDENLMIRGMPLHILSTAATTVLQNRMKHVLFEWDSLPLQWRGSHLVDLDSIYRLGGLICIVEGDPYVFDETRCTSWCVIRHDLTGILLYKGLIDDAYDNKHRMFCEDSRVDYIGTMQVTTTDGITMVSCLHEDGTCYDGHFQKFALESHGTCENGSTCARKALSGLPGSKFLENSSLQCNALQMVAFAFAAGHQHYKLQWSGDDGHIECEAEDGSTRNLKACHVLFTKEALIVEHDVVWRGDGGEGVWFPSYHLAGSEPQQQTTSSTGKIEEKSMEKSIQELGRKLLLPEHPTAEETQKVDAAVVMAFKRNWSVGIGLLGFQLSGAWETRPKHVTRVEEDLMCKLLSAMAMAGTIVVPPESRDEVHRLVEVKLRNGSISNCAEDYLVIKNSYNDNCMQVFMYDQGTKRFIFLTDIIEGDPSVVSEIFRSSLHGSSLEVTRYRSEIRVGQEFFSNSSPIRFAEKIIRKGRNVLKDMVHHSELQGLPNSDDCWKHMIGDQIKYNRKDFFWRSTEIQAIVCGATRFKTGGAFTCTLTLNNGICIHGHCECSAVPCQYVPTIKVKAVGKFSRHKGGGPLDQVYWG